MKTPPRHPTCRRSHMTMVELMVAMSILVILMWVVMRTFSSTQTIWRTTQDTLTTYEDARLAMDLINRDLRSMVVSRVEDREINFTLDPAFLPPKGTTNESWLIALITSSGIGVEDDSDELMIEAAYYYKTNAGGEDTKLYRAMTAQQYSNVDEAKWNFEDGALPTTWAARTSFKNETLIAENVITCDFRAFNTDGESMNTTVYDTMPAYLEIEMELGTYESNDDSDVRKFTKRIYLRGQ